MSKEYSSLMNHTAIWIKGRSFLLYSISFFINHNYYRRSLNLKLKDLLKYLEF